VATRHGGFSGLKMCFDGISVDASVAMGVASAGRSRGTLIPSRHDTKSTWNRLAKVLTQFLVDLIQWLFHGSRGRSGELGVLHCVVA
jgi:hypothetical protein